MSWIAHSSLTTARSRRGMARLVVALLASVACGAAPAAAGADEEPAATSAGDPCVEASYRAFAVVPSLFLTGEADSLFAELDAWADGCGPAETIFRTAVLASIWEGSFTEDLYDDAVLDHLLWFTEKQRRVHVETHGNRQSPYFAVAAPVDDMPGHAAYDSFTIEVAYQLLPHLEPGSLQEGFALHYRSQAEGALFPRLRRRLYAGSDLQAYYDAEIDYLEAAAAWEWGVFGGLWSPQRQLGVLGAHPLLGLRVGRWVGRGFVRLSTEFRFLDAHSPYLIWYKDEAVVTDQYSALQLALEFGVNLAHFGRVGVDLLGAAGWEGISYSSEIEDWLGTLVLGAGLQARVTLDRISGQTLFCDLRAEDTRFSTRGGTDLDGYAWNLRFGFSQALDLNGRRRLEMLRGVPER